MVGSGCLGEYNRLTGVATLGDTLRVPHLCKNGPTFFVGYQWTLDRNATTDSAVIPDLAERNEVFSNSVLDPITGAQFPGNTIPWTRISPQAWALLSF